MLGRANAGEEQTDVVVVGSGAAGLSAALTAAVKGARVRLLEGSDKLGGTTAWSGGLIWMPCNHRQSAAGVDDSREAANDYLRASMGDAVNLTLLDPFLDRGPEAVRFLDEHSRLRLVHCDLPDSLTNLPGASERGRNLEARPFPRRSLGRWRHLVRPSLFPVHLTVSEMHAHDLKALARKTVVRTITDRVGCGTAIVCGLLKACLDQGVAISVQARCRNLTEESGRIVGVAAEVPGGTLRVRAAGGVVLATGGFDWNTELVDRFLPIDASTMRRGTPPVLRGDGLLMAEEAGANLVYTDEGWWWPVADIPGETYEGRSISRMIVFEKTRPHTIVVNREGQRFVNESMHHMAFSLLERDENGERPNLPSWVVFDRRYRKANVVVNVLPIQPDPSWLIKADTIDNLAAKIGIDAAGLRATVERWNTLCRNGVDVDFGRGATAYDRHHGDQRAPHPNLGTIEEPPFYALPIDVSPVGTKGGPEIDATGRVLRRDGESIPGLYAAGNVAGRLLGPAIYGAGVTIATGATFGYLGGMHAAGEAAARRSGSAL